MADNLNVSDIAKFFIKEGYQVMGINQIWRSTTGHLKKDGVEYYLKLASTDTVSESLQNEISWNKNIQSLYKEKDFDRLIVPQIEDEGFYKGKAYFLSRYYYGKPLANRDFSKQSDIQKYLDTIVDIAVFILRTENVELYKDHLLTDKQKTSEFRAEEYISLTKEFAKDLKQNDVSDLLQIVEEIRGNLKLALNHNSFDVREMLAEGSKIVLIDAEDASEYSPKYNDIAHCYTTLLTRVTDKDIAQDFLNQVKEQLNEDEEADFSSLLRPLIASNLIGCYWDSEKEGNHIFDAHNVLRDKLIAREVF
jgi:hypothetical protein